MLVLLYFIYFIHLFPTSLCGVLVFGCVLPPACLPASSSRRLLTTYSHTTCSHTTCSHISYSHTTCSHKPYSHTTYSLTHTQLSHTHNSHTHTELTHIHTLTHNHNALQFTDTQLSVALRLIELHFAWQAWHLVTWIVTLRGERGTYGTWLALVARLGPVWRRCCRGCL